MIKLIVKPFVLVCFSAYFGIVLYTSDKNVTLQSDLYLGKTQVIAFSGEDYFEKAVGRAKVTPADAYKHVIEFREELIESGGWMGIVWDSPSYILAGHYVFAVKNKFYYPLKGYAVNMKTGKVSIIESDILLPIE